ncbi:hypothetical protein K402DRAFT_156668 [Aulographum hederae CBS 113979]|uniref:Uncharacterized protein n=1 Tax=Aulographum hederae CBS 113979 TaxID=1176131 RepID=A0A6G1GSQ9_9PEZI|nr:hypothetical protein K402DRAFT_156668 [Aulographum hederae CBS 113979]
MNHLSAYFRPLFGSTDLVSPRSGRRSANPAGATHPSRLPVGTPANDNPSAPFSHIRIVQRPSEAQDEPLARNRSRRGGREYLHEPDLPTFTTPSHQALSDTITRPETSNNNRSSPSRALTFADMARAPPQAHRDISSDMAAPAASTSASSSNVVRLKPRSRAANWQKVDLGELLGPQEWESDDASHDTSIKSQPANAYHARSRAPSRADVASSHNQQQQQHQQDLHNTHIRQPQPHPAPNMEKLNALATHLHHTIEVFGERLPDPDFLLHNKGSQDGKLQFVEHPNGDIAAHQWNHRAQRWANIGQYSYSRKKVEGSLASERLRGQTVGRIEPQNTVEYFFKISKQREAAYLNPGQDMRQGSSGTGFASMPMQRPSLSTYASMSSAGPMPQDNINAQAEARAALNALSIGDLRGGGQVRGLAKRLTPETRMPTASPSHPDDPFVSPHHSPHLSRQMHVLPFGGLATRAGAENFEQHGINRSVDFGLRYSPAPPGYARSKYTSDSGLSGATRLTSDNFPHPRQDPSALSNLREVDAGEEAATANARANQTIAPAQPLVAIQNQNITARQSISNNDRDAMLSYLNRTGHAAPTFQSQNMQRSNMANTVESSRPDEYARPHIRSENSGPVRTVLHDPLQAKTLALPARHLQAKPSSSATYGPREMRNDTFKPAEEQPFAGHSTQDDLSVSQPEEGWRQRPAAIYDNCRTGHLSDKELDEYWTARRWIPNAPHLQEPIAIPQGVTPNISTRFLTHEYADELDNWWQSGTQTERQDDFYKTLLNAPTPPGLPSYARDPRNPREVNHTMSRLLIPLYENLEAYVRAGPGGYYQRRKEEFEAAVARNPYSNGLFNMAPEEAMPGLPPGSFNYLNPFTKPPEWMIDKSATGNQSFFGEDFGRAPKRVGRDPRFRDEKWDRYFSSSPAAGPSTRYAPTPGGGSGFGGAGGVGVVGGGSSSGHGTRRGSGSGVMYAPPSAPPSRGLAGLGGDSWSGAEVSESSSATAARMRGSISSAGGGGGVSLAGTGMGMESSPAPRNSYESIVAAREERMRNTRMGRTSHGGGPFRG